MKEKLTQRAFDAILEYDEARIRVDGFSKLIADCFKRCTMRQCEEEKNSTSHSHFPPDLVEMEPCLKANYNENRTYNTYGDLGGACEYCEQADDYIQQRKNARWRFGIAKRKIASIAKALKTHADNLITE